MNNFFFLFFVTKLIVLYLFKEVFELLFISNAIHSLLFLFFFSHKINFKRSHKLIVFSIDSTLPLFGILIILLFNLLYKYRIFEQHEINQNKLVASKEKQELNFFTKAIIYSSNKSKLELIKQLSVNPNYDQIRILMLALDDNSDEIKEFTKSTLLKIQKEFLSSTFTDENKQINHYMFMFECNFINVKSNFDIYEKCLKFFKHQFEMNNNNVDILKSLGYLYLLNNDYENHIKFNNYLLQTTNNYQLHLDNAKAFFKLKDFDSLKKSLVNYKLHASTQEKDTQKDILNWWLQNE